MDSGAAEPSENKQEEPGTILREAEETSDTSGSPPYPKSSDPKTSVKGPAPEGYAPGNAVDMLKPRATSCLLGRGRSWTTSPSHFPPTQQEHETWQPMRKQFNSEELLAAHVPDKELDHFLSAHSALQDQVQSNPGEMKPRNSWGVLPTRLLKPWAKQKALLVQ